MARKPGLACHACNRNDFYTEASLKRHTAKFHTPGQKSPRGFRTRRDPNDKGREVWSSQDERVKVYFKTVREEGYPSEYMGWWSVYVDGKLKDSHSSVNDRDARKRIMGTAKLLEKRIIVRDYGAGSVMTGKVYSNIARRRRQYPFSE